MPIVTETGSGAANSESYISVVDADLYHSNRGNAGWATLALAAKEQFLRKATDYMVQFYRHKWNGWRVLLTQALDWPRQGVYLDDYGYPQSGSNYGTYVNLIANNVVPLEVARACAELALIASSTPLAPNVERVEQSVSVGPISVSYAPGASVHTQYRAVDLLLKPFLDTGLGVKVLRA